MYYYSKLKNSFFKIKMTIKKNSVFIITIILINIITILSKYTKDSSFDIPSTICKYPVSIIVKNKDKNEVEEVLRFNIQVVA